MSNLYARVSLAADKRPWSELSACLCTQELSTSSGTIQGIVTGGGTGTDAITGVSPDVDGRPIVSGYTNSPSLTIGAATIASTGTGDHMWIAGHALPLGVSAIAAAHALWGGVSM